MDDQDTLFNSRQKHEPWNKGKFTGAKPPLRPKHVWSIRSKLFSLTDGRFIAIATDERRRKFLRQDNVRTGKFPSGGKDAGVEQKSAASRFR